MKPEAKWGVRAERYRRKEGVAPAGRKGRYIWRVPPDYRARTRPDHLALDGQEFNWDEPPVHDRRTGARGHPGSDKACRCFAEPVSRSDGE